MFRWDVHHKLGPPKLQIGFWLHHPPKKKKKTSGRHNSSTFWGFTSPLANNYSSAIRPGAQRLDKKRRYLSGGTARVGFEPPGLFPSLGMVRFESAVIYRGFYATVKGSPPILWLRTVLIMVRCLKIAAHFTCISGTPWDVNHIFESMRVVQKTTAVLWKVHQRFSWSML